MRSNKATIIIIVSCLVVYLLFKQFAFQRQYKIEHKRSTSTTEQNADAGFNRSNDHLKLTKHAKCRMDCRHITENELKEILHDGNINYNKSELNDTRGPKYALEGYTIEHQHLRVIFAPEVNDMVVVTCIDLDTEWQCPSCN